MAVNEQNSGIQHEFPDGKQLTVGELANGQFGWWIDAPGSEAKLLKFGRCDSTCTPCPRGLLDGEEPTFGAAVASGKTAWTEKYGTEGE